MLQCGEICPDLKCIKKGTKKLKKTILWLISELLYTELSIHQFWKIMYTHITTVRTAEGED
jgi:hypothetical protein